METTTATGSTITLLEREQVFNYKMLFFYIVTHHYYWLSLLASNEKLAFQGLTVILGHLEHQLSHT